MSNPPVRNHLIGPYTPIKNQSVCSMKNLRLGDKLLHANQVKVNYQFSITISNLTLFETGLKEAKILWKRGTSASGKSEYTDIKDGTMFWKHTFTIQSTMYKGKKGYEKKLINFELEFLDWKGKLSILGKGELDVSTFCFDDVPLKMDQARVVMNIGGATKKSAVLEVIIESKNLDVKITEKDKERFSQSFRGTMITGSDPSQSSSSGSGDLEKEVATLKKKLKLQQEEYDLLNEDFDKYRDENQGDGDEQVEKLRSVKQELERTIDGLNDRLDKELKAKERLIKENNELQDLMEDQQSDMLKQKKDMMKNKDTEPSQKEKTVSTPDGTADIVLKRKNAELEKLKQENEELQEDRDLLEADFVKMKNKVKTLEEQMKILQSKSGSDAKNDNVRLVQELQDARGKLDEIQKDRDLALRDLKNLKKGDVQSTTLERFIFENAIHFCTPEYQKDMPISLKIVYLAMLEWGVFDSKKNVTFLENFLRSLEYILERHIRDLDVSVYWIQVMTRLLFFAKKDYPKEFESVMERMQDIDEVNLAPQQVKIEARQLPPEFYEPKMGKSRFGQDIELNVILYIEALNKVLQKTYLQLLQVLYDRIDRILADCVQKAQSNQNVQASLNDLRCSMINLILEEHYTEFKKQNLDVLILNHFFETVAIHCDEFLFNLMCNETMQSGKVMQVKMTVSALESWFDLKMIVTSLKKWFLYTRQASDVCILQQKSLLTDESMRNAMCPNLSDSQVSRLLSNCSKDLDPNKTKISNDGKQVLIKSKVEFYSAMDPNKKQLVKGNIFNLDLTLTKAKFATMQVSQRFLEKPEFEFLL